MKVFTLAAMTAGMMAVATAAAPRDGVPAPWWDRFPAFVQTDSPAQGAREHATAVLCGAADDPTWGLFGQRQRIVPEIKHIRELHANGIKALSWFEGFGTAGTTYIAEVKRGPDGKWIKTPGDPTLTRIFHNHWSWQQYDGTGEIRWVGAQSYFDNESFAQLYTRTHPRYGAPPMRYPDGRIATGYNGPATDPRNSRVFDAGCSKNVLGQVTFDYEYNDVVNQIDRASGKPHGPIAGLINTGAAPPGVPDPGYTPEEWARLKKQLYSGCISPGKDIACPIWADYVRASVRQALDAGIDGLWVDNFSPWDSFNGWPVQKAFGEWSVAGFRGYLKTDLRPADLRRLGIADASRFDVRAYLRNRCKTFGGDPTNLSDERWRDARWQDDPIWRAYLIYRRHNGTAALSRFYRTIKEEARKAGKPDFLVMGNDIPVFSLGWPRGDLDMVSTELSWGWGLTSGPRGLMPPPYGSYVPVYKLAREHARSRFVNIWMYVPQEQKGKSNIARVLYYQALANHAGPMPLYPQGTAGNPATDAAYFAFIRRAAPVFGNRRAIEEVGLYSSSSSQLMEMVPGGFRRHALQPHSFSFFGWGAALTGLHIPWRALPEWKLTTANLAGLKALILPSAQVFAKEDVPTLDRWVRAGGTLIIAGDCGSRLGESGDFARSPGGTLVSLRSGRLGRGRVARLGEDPGIAFYQADKDRPSRLRQFARALAAVSGLTISAPAVPWQVGLTPYRDRGRLFVDVNNTAIDLNSDTLKPAPPVAFTVTLPADLRGRRLAARVLSPDGTISVKAAPAANGQAAVSLGSVPVYASVLIEAAR